MTQTKQAAEATRLARTTTLEGILETLRPLLGQAIVVSGPGGERRETVDTLTYTDGVPDGAFSTRNGKRVHYTADQLLWSFGGFVVRAEDN